MLAVGLLLLVGLGYRFTLRAQTAPDDGEDKPPTVTAAPAKTILPEDFPVDDVEMFGATRSEYDDAEYRVFEYHGDFKLDFAKRRMSAKNAVVWARSEKLDGKVAQYFTVYLDGGVRISEIGGTAMSAKRQIVTFESTGRIWANSNEKVPGGADSPLYRQAKSFRTRATTTQAAIEPEEPASQPERPVQIVTPPSPFRYGAKRTSVMVRGEERVVLAEGDVYVSRTMPMGKVEKADTLTRPNSKMFMEISADRGVFYAKESKLQQAMARPTSAPDLPQILIGAYLEGAVTLHRGEQTIEASQLYYDFEHERALILDAVLFQPHQSRKVPMIVLAEEIRQLSGTAAGGKTDEPATGEMIAYNARVTSSAMWTPQYDLKAKEIYLRVTEKPDGHTELFYKTRNEQVEVRGTPISYSPGSEGTFDEEETAIRTVQAGVASDFGAFVNVRWNLFKLLNQPKPAGVNATLDTGFYGDRGPKASVQGDWTRTDERAGTTDKGYGLVSGMFDRGWDPAASINANSNLKPEAEDNGSQDQFRARGPGAGPRPSLHAERLGVDQRGELDVRPRPAVRLVQVRVRHRQGAGDAALPEKVVGQQRVHRPAGAADQLVPQPGGEAARDQVLQAGRAAVERSAGVFQREFRGPRGLRG